MAKAPTKKETTKATAKPAPKAKPAPVVEAPAKAPKAAKPPVPKKYERLRRSTLRSSRAIICPGLPYLPVHAARIRSTKASPCIRTAHTP
jgi:hypothetical protein